MKSADLHSVWEEFRPDFRMIVVLNLWKMNCANLTLCIKNKLSVSCLNNIFQCLNQLWNQHPSPGCHMYPNMMWGRPRLHHHPHPHQKCTPQMHQSRSLLLLVVLKINMPRSGWQLYLLRSLRHPRAPSHGPTPSLSSQMRCHMKTVMRSIADLSQ